MCVQGETQHVTALATEQLSCVICFSWTRERKCSFLIVILVVLSTAVINMKVAYKHKHKKKPWHAFFVCLFGLFYCVMDSAYCLLRTSVSTRNLDE